MLGVITTRSSRKILVFIINYSSALGEPLGSRCVRVQKTLMQGREAERLSGYKGVSRPYVSSVVSLIRHSIVVSDWPPNFRAVPPSARS